MMKHPLTSLFYSSLIFAISCTAKAELWVDTNDAYLRADLQYLAAQGLIRTPLNSYPLRWSALGKELNNINLSILPASTASIVQRVHQAYQSSLAPTSGSLRAHAAAEAAQFRRFGSDYREKSEVAASVFHQSGPVVGKVAITAVPNATDGKTFRPDDSYLAVVAGNWALSAGYIDQWWGPGFDSALHKSTNARPLPSLMLSTFHPTEYDNDWLSWVGPWSFYTSVSKMEHERAIANPLLWSNRVNFAPFSKLELGLSWTSQLCGEGLTCNLDAFKDVIGGSSACPESDVNCDASRQSKTGNQMAGFDLLYRDLWFGRPVALYLERTCEDSSGSSPLDIADCANMAGANSWFELAQHQITVFVEYSNTMVACGLDEKSYNCFYEHGTYTSGSRYYQRSLGSTYDSDARSWVVGAIVRLPDNSGLYATLRDIKLNHDGVRLPSDFTPDIAKQQIRQLDLNYQQALWRGTIKLGASTAMIDGAQQANKREHNLYSGYVYRF